MNRVCRSFFWIFGLFMPVAVSIWPWIGEITVAQCPQRVSIRRSFIQPPGKKLVIFNISGNCVSDAFAQLLYSWLFVLHVFSIFTCVEYVFGDHGESSGWLGGAPRVVKGHCRKKKRMCFTYCCFSFVWWIQDPSGVIQDIFLIFLNPCAVTLMSLGGVVTDMTSKLF